MPKKPSPIWVPIKGKDKLSKTLTKLQRKMGCFSKKVNKMGKGLSTSVTLPTLAIGAASAKMSMDLNKNMGNVQSLLDGTLSETTKRTNELKGSVQDLAKKTGMNTASISKGAYEVVSAFGDMRGETEAILGTMTKMATAGGSDVAEALQLTSAVTKAYGDTSAEAQKKVADFAFQTVKLGQTDFPALAGSIGKVAPMAGELGVQMDEMFGVMATATGVTGNAAEVATQFRGVLKSLAGPTDTMNMLFDKYNVKTGAEFIKVSGGIQGAMNTITKEAKAAGIPLKDLIGSIEGQNIALALTGKQADTFTDKLGKMKNGAGALNDAFQKKTQGVDKSGFAIRKMTQQITVMAQVIGDKLLPVLAQMLNNFIVPIVTWFGNLSGEAMTVILMFGGIVAAIGPALLIFGKMFQAITVGIKIIAMLRKAFVFLNVVMTANPVGAIIIGVVALVAAIVLLIKNWDTVVAKFKSGGRFISRIFGGGKDNDTESSTPIGKRSSLSKIEKSASGGLGNNTTTNNARMQLDINGAPQGSKLITKSNDGVNLDTNLGLAGNFGT